MLFKFIITIALLGFTQPLFAQIQHFNSSELRGINKAMLDDKTGRLICFWQHSDNPLVSSGITVYEIADNRLIKVWEDAETFFTARAFDTGDLNNDGRLDFAVGGTGYVEGEFMHFVVSYFNTGSGDYEKRIVPRSGKIRQLAIGDVDGDGQNEVAFSEVTEAHRDWYNMELRFFNWDHGSYYISNTGIFKGSDAWWGELYFSDTDGDGKDEALLNSFSDWGWSVNIHDLDPVDPSSGPAHTIQLHGLESTISVTGKGRILELGKTAVTPLSIGGRAFKIAPIDIAELDFVEWSPVEISESTTGRVVVSKPANDRLSVERRISIYRF